jgi:hypothetical protein
MRGVWEFVFGANSQSEVLFGQVPGTNTGAAPGGGASQQMTTTIVPRSRMPHFARLWWRRDIGASAGADGVTECAAPAPVLAAGTPIFRVPTESDLEYYSAAPRSRVRQHGAGT